MSKASAERIKEIIRQSGVSVRRLADELGISNVAIYKWQNGGEPQGENLKRFCDYFKVAPAYVLYGDVSDPRHQSVVINEDVISIPLLDVQAACGFDLKAEDAHLIRMVDCDKGAIAKLLPGARLESLNMVTVVGDSMSPTLDKGDVVIVDISDKSVKEDGIYVVCFDSCLYVKRIQRVPGAMLLLSDNERYQPIKITPQDDVAIVGKAYIGLKVLNLF